MATQFSASGGASPAGGGGGGQREIRLGVIGAGNIATAILRGLVGQGVVSPSNVWCSSPSGPRRPIADLGVRTTRDNAEVAKNADVLILAVKPYILASACESLKGALKPATLVVSVSAGISLAQTTAMLGAPPGGIPWRVIRVMPNTPASVGMGASAMCLGPFAGPADSELVSRLFSAVGTVDVVAEAMMDAVTGLSGSGPAYVCMFIEALADGGVASGLTRAVAMSLAVQLVRGAAGWVQETGTHPAALKDAVASPGGTTIAGIHELERGGFRAAVMSAVVAATKRGGELREAEEKSRAAAAIARSL